MITFLTMIAITLSPEAIERCANVWCKDVRMSWEHPYQREDGSELLISDIANTEIFCGSSPEGLDELPSTAIVDAPASRAEVPLPEGHWHCAGRTVDTDGIFSPLSEIAEVLVEPGPREPILIDIWQPLPVEELRTVDDGVYVIFQSANRISLSWVGTVSVGTLCNPMMGVNGYYLVPREEVTWADPRTQPQAVVARCAAE